MTGPRLGEIIKYENATPFEHQLPTARLCVELGYSFPGALLHHLPAASQLCGTVHTFAVATSSITGYCMVFDTVRRVQQPRDRLSQIRTMSSPDIWERYSCLRQHGREARQRGTTAAHRREPAPALVPVLDLCLHDLHHVLIQQHVLLAHPLRAVLGGNPPHKRILELFQQVRGNLVHKRLHICASAVDATHHRIRKVRLVPHLHTESCYAC